MTPSPSDRRARGIAIRQARRARVSSIRRRVVASALALFVGTWLLITMLLISGHDPALARTKTVTTASTPAATTTSAPASTTSTSNPTTRTSGTTTSTPTTASTSTPTTTTSTPSAGSGSSGSSSSATALTSSQS